MRRFAFKTCRKACLGQIWTKLDEAPYFSRPYELQVKRRILLKCIYHIYWLLTLNLSWNLNYMILEITDSLENV